MFQINTDPHVEERVLRASRHAELERDEFKCNQVAAKAHPSWPPFVILGLDPRIFLQGSLTLLEILASSALLSRLI